MVVVFFKICSIMWKVFIRHCAIKLWQAVLMGLPVPLQPEMVVGCGGMGEGSLQDLIMVRSPLAF